jgi:hypothetical protein
MAFDYVGCAIRIDLFNHDYGILAASPRRSQGLLRAAPPGPLPAGLLASQREGWERNPPGLYRRFIALHNRVINEVFADSGAPVPFLTNRQEVANCAYPARRILSSAAFSLKQKVSRLEDFFRQQDDVLREEARRLARAETAAAIAKAKQKARDNRATCNKKSPAHKRQRSPSPPPKGVIKIEKGTAGPPARKRARRA